MNNFHYLVFAKRKLYTKASTSKEEDWKIELLLPVNRLLLDTTHYNRQNNNTLKKLSVVLFLREHQSVKLERKKHVLLGKKTIFFFSLVSIVLGNNHSFSSSFHFLHKPWFDVDQNCGGDYLEVKLISNFYRCLEPGQLCFLFGRVRFKNGSLWNTQN
jgi:hypothetical protein